MIEHRFAFIIHALDAKDAARKYPLARYLPDRWVEGLMRLAKPQVLSEITGVTSATGAQTEGWFVGLPRTARQLMDHNGEGVEVVIQAARVAEELGAEIVGLGAYTSIIGDGGKQIADAVDIAVTTGNSYTVYTAVEGALRAAEMMGTDPSQAAVTVLGATGSIGRACALLLAERVGSVALSARRLDRLSEVAEEVRAVANGRVTLHADVADALSGADIVITVTSALDSVVEPEHLKPGAVVCDVARPRDVSKSVVQQRQDVLVIEGGVVRVPGPVEFNFNFGFPPRTSYACMAETMILALEGRIEDYSIGRQLEVEKVREIGKLAEKHGFELSGFRSFERAVSQEDLAHIRERAERARSRAQ
ncbi:MAG: NAD(P)H-binding protein [Armatimonadota bacterium]